MDNDFFRRTGFGHRDWGKSLEGAAPRFGLSLHADPEFEGCRAARAAGIRRRLHRIHYRSNLRFAMFGQLIRVLYHEGGCFSVAVGAWSVFLAACTTFRSLLIALTTINI